MSISDLVDHIFPIVKNIKHFLLRNHWESKNKIGQVRIPILFIMSEKDELVPHSHMKKLATLADNASFTESVNKFYFIML